MTSTRLYLLSLLAFVFGCSAAVHGSENAPGDETHRIAGIGIQAGGDTSGPRLRDHVIVRRVLPGGPALKAGMLADDEIVEVDGQKVAGMKLVDAVNNLIRGPLGSVVKITVVRETVDVKRSDKTVDLKASKRQHFVFDLVRDIVPVEQK